MDCGPRNRFVIAAGRGPLIVHNCENIVQATAADLLWAAIPKAEAAGYPVVLRVHDELLTEPEDSDAFNVAGLAKLMTDTPAWAAGLPVAAAGFEAQRYKKG